MKKIEIMNENNQFKKKQDKFIDKIDNVEGQVRRKNFVNKTDI